MSAPKNKARSRRRPVFDLSTSTDPIKTPCMARKEIRRRNRPTKKETNA